ncbi:DNA phosphorothioation-dependent restriction protein DptF [Alteromonas antoniana]|uniref:DNA phosphorothioation-dependent restriction protein DptF n=1 Tax=Alteromonas antoniana TaxID=2803813 RepID=UPI001C45286B|nr:DNA phosphorothioation-dependent restriction protein DptF [Alteromonas antoniana]
MRLLDVLSVLSKSSPYAVSTEREDSISEQLDAVKKYLYIETEIQRDFEKQLTSLSPGDKKIIFLCGSSGDGKSEILTQFGEKFANKAKFHLDATHSFNPDSTAITTLDEVFVEYENSNKALVVGINVGMMGNYAEEGANTAVCNAIKKYLDSKYSSPGLVFLNFEDYPKFQLTKTGHSSDFVKAVLVRLTQQENNLIRQYFDIEKASHDGNKKLIANYQLLSLPEVQDRIIDVLFKARLIKDQFLTARTLLDFIHNLLSPDGYLFDNMFSQSDNEILSKITEFNPADIRTENIDKFILGTSLGLSDERFDEFATLMSAEYGIRRSKNPHAYLRLFYLLNNAEIGNNYHQDFKADFEEPLLDQYAKAWNLHSNFSGDKEDRRLLKSLYKDTIFASIHAYVNRNARSVAKGKYLISIHNDYQIMSEIEMEPDFDAIQASAVKSSSFFTAFMSVEGKQVDIPVNINLLTMMKRIINGYRPNKHDKNTIVLLDEVADHIAQIASKKNKLLIVKGNQNMSLKFDGDEIEVSGI